ncbi:hypothetical protein EVAR_42655_1 [Eumeta japonica]|uniref:Uncharacterized protein n=1 Tax=Eumeta variegata TaxID=151549 RepID=A0A4C1YR43_EUMVA|nr:hypothetical protein EVAR_42655_1 [Eumeta japonica]
MTTGPRKDPPNNVPNVTSTEDIKTLLSVINSIDVGEFALLAKKFKVAANFEEKIIILAEHASLVKGLMMELEGGHRNSVTKRRNPIEFGLV